MNRAQLLGQLAAIDAQITARTKSLKELEANLADTRRLAPARLQSEGAAAAAVALRAKLQDAELQNKTIGDKLKATSARLYGGRVANPKELDGLQQDEQMLKRQRDALEEQILNLMEQVDQAEARAREARAAFDTAATREDKSQAQWTREVEQHRALLQGLARQRADLVAQIAPEDLQTYTATARTHGGRGAAAIKGNVCTACGMELPSGHVSRVRTGESLVFCTGCGRILVP